LIELVVTHLTFGNHAKEFYPSIGNQNLKTLVLKEILSIDKTFESNTKRVGELSIKNSTPDKEEERMETYWCQLQLTTKHINFFL
jgi:hypothetical protein